MASLQHVFRRGHIFWWRRIHSSFHTRPIDVRLSLGTPDRLQARNRGAALTAAYDRVVAMLNERIAQRDLTEGELRTILHDMYEALLTRLCDEQRASPGDAQLLSDTNHGFLDYFERLTSLGGHASLLPDEVRRLQSSGWDDRRIADLRCIIDMRADRGISPIRHAEIDQHLRRAGLVPDDRLRWKVEQALFPVYADAYVEAEMHLRNGCRVEGAADQVMPASPTVAEPAVAQPMPAVGIPDDWLTCTPVHAAKRMIADNPKLFAHRQEGKRAAGTVGEQTHRQILWAAALLEKSLPRGTPLWQVTRDDIVELDKLFDKLPVHFGKAPRDREAGRRLEDVAAEVPDLIAKGDLAPEDVGLSIGTANRHFNKLGQIHDFMRANVPTAITIKFTDFTTTSDQNDCEARLRYTREQGEAIFRLPPWTGCAGLNDRLESGKLIFHDALFYVLLLVWYTGARREELCKLMLADVEERHGVFYFLVRVTEMGRIKNAAARRVVVIHDELIRLGFLRYVEAMRAAGETLLFPEIVPGGDARRKLGDVFYKLWWIYLRPFVPDLKRGQAMHAARHMVADEMKDQEVFIEFRNDHLGHRGKGEGETRYPSAASLRRLKETVAKIPVVTGHLAEQVTINLLPDHMRKARPTRG